MNQPVMVMDGVANGSECGVDSREVNGYTHCVVS